MAAARRIMWLYLGTGLAIFLLMVVAGIVLRAEQAGWIPLDPGWFYTCSASTALG